MITFVNLLYMIMLATTLSTNTLLSGECVLYQLVDVCFDIYNQITVVGSDTPLKTLLKGG